MVHRKQVSIRVSSAQASSGNACRMALSFSCLRNPKRASYDTLLRRKSLNWWIGWDSILKVLIHLTKMIRRRATTLQSQLSITLAIHLRRTSKHSQTMTSTSLISQEKTSLLRSTTLNMQANMTSSLIWLRVKYLLKWVQSSFKWSRIQCLLCTLHQGLN